MLDWLHLDATDLQVAFNGQKLPTFPRAFVPFSCFEASLWSPSPLAVGYSTVHSLSLGYGTSSTSILPFCPFGLFLGFPSYLALR